MSDWLQAIEKTIGIPAFDVLLNGADQLAGEIVRHIPVKKR
jgi:hypothetical protein